MGQMKSIQQYLDLPYHVSVVRNENERGQAGWAASVEELPACTAVGNSPEEAVQRVRKAMKQWISSALERNEEIPEPRSGSSASGRLLVRMPKTLHGQLARAAEQEGVSLNQFITSALASAVTWRGLNPASKNSRPAAGSHEKPAAAPGFRGWLRENLLVAALIANFVVVAVAGIVAIGLLAAAWDLDSDDEPGQTTTQTRTGAP
jgi:predicted RNase H-like HicB family nuclease